MRYLVILSTLLCGSAFAQKRKTYPQAPDEVPTKEAFEMASELPMNFDAFKFIVRGKYGGHTYFESEVPTYKIESNGLLEDGKLAVGAEVLPIKFIPSNRGNLYQVVPAGTDLKNIKKEELRWVKGLFLTARAKKLAKKLP